MERLRWIGRGSWWVYAALVLGAAGGCESASSEPALLIEPPGGLCSDLTRTLAGWQGREYVACEAGWKRFVTLTPVGDGYVLSWMPESGEAQLWHLEPEHAAEQEPLTTDLFESIRDGQLLGQLGRQRVFNYDPKGALIRSWGVNFDARGLDDPLPLRPAEQTWDAPPLGGRALVALDAGHLLDIRPGTGEYSIIQYRERSTDDASFERLGEMSATMLGKSEHFRRGYRWVALGENRLLAWHPVLHSYAIWQYDVGRLPASPFDPEPVAVGEWPELGREHDLLVLDRERLGVWNRARGSIEFRSFDPFAADPLAGRSEGVFQDDRLRSFLPAWEKEPSSKIRRIIIVFQQGGSFDTHFGGYCHAPAGSEPGCTSGPECCEAAPERFLAEACPTSGSASEPVAATPHDPSGPIAQYHALAQRGALADRYFPSAGTDDLETDALINLYYCASASFLGYSESPPPIKTITELLAGADVPFAVYLGRGLENRLRLPPPTYYDGTWDHARLLDELAYDVRMEQLAPISIVLPGPSENENPEIPGSLERGVAFTTDLVRAIEASERYAGETLIVLTHLTSGRSCDHVPRPPLPLVPVPNEPEYGRRAPFLALGPFVRRNHVSHVTLEHSSLTAFLEWNWLHGKVGQLQGRDGVVSGIGSLLDPATTGTAVP